MRDGKRKEERSGGNGLAAIAFTLAALILLAGAARASAQSQNAAQSLPPMMSYGTGQGGSVTGLIVSRQGDDMLIRDETTRALSTVTLTAGTSISSPSGLLKMDRKPQDVTNLIPGLIVAVKGSGGSRGNLVADKIVFHKSALRVANQISAGQVELRAQQRATASQAAATATLAAATAAVADANTDSIAEAKARARDSLDAVHARMSDLDAYDVKFSGTVLFATGSAKLTDDAKAALDDMVSKGLGLTGYLIEVAGFADSTGSAGLNQRLSERRAEAVVAYLTQERNVPLRRIVNPTGFGETHATAANDTVEGRAQNRRVEVKVLLNRGLQAPDKP